MAKVESALVRKLQQQVEELKKKELDLTAKMWCTVKARDEHLETCKSIRKAVRMGEERLAQVVLWKDKVIEEKEREIEEKELEIDEKDQVIEEEECKIDILEADIVGLRGAGVSEIAEERIAELEAELEAALHLVCAYAKVRKIRPPAAKRSATQQLEL